MRCKSELAGKKKIMKILKGRNDGEETVIAVLGGGCW